MASRGHAKTSEALGGRDPRARRGQGPSFNEDVQVGKGLRIDRDGRIEIKPAEGIEELPSIGNVDELREYIERLLRVLRDAGFIEE